MPLVTTLVLDRPCAGGGSTHLQSRQVKILPRVLVIGGLCALLAGWLGCSEERDYKTLSFFFDGVPDPKLKGKNPLTLNASGRSGGAMISTHKPYVEQKCGECHPSQGLPTVALQNTDLCVKCHEKVMDQYPVMHGPVVGKACLWCHAPHESINKVLLRTTTSALCFQCHERELISTKTFGHQEGQGNCLDCHFGHGSDKLPFLKPEGERPKPAPPEGVPPTNLPLDVP